MRKKGHLDQGLVVCYLLPFVLNGILGDQMTSVSAVDGEKEKSLTVTRNGTKTSGGGSVSVRQLN